MELNGKVAIVTGAGRGIGAAIARTLGAAGARVIVNYNRSAEAAGALAAEINGLPVAADVGTAEGCAALIAAAESLGSLDILVNNAGITRDMLLLRMTDEEWNDVIKPWTEFFSCCRCPSSVSAPLSLPTVTGPWTSRRQPTRRSWRLFRRRDQLPRVQARRACTGLPACQ